MVVAPVCFLGLHLSMGNGPELSILARSFQRQSDKRQTNTKYIGMEQNYGKGNDTLEGRLLLNNNRDRKN